MKSEVALPYTPREQFLPFHQRSERWGLMVCHRRAGKTVACIGELIIRALYTKKKNARYAYVGPYRKQAKEVAWEYLKDFTEDIRQGPPRESDLCINFHNGARITLYGSDNSVALLGLYFDGIILDEFGDMHPNLWGSTILPTLLDRKGWAVFIGTPKGKNHFYRMKQRSEAEDTWYGLTLKASDSGLLSQEDLDEARAEMTDEQYEREIECSFEATVEGAYYSSTIADMERSDINHFDEYPYDPSEMVHCALDLGFTDSTAIWFWQLTPNGPNLIDYEEHDGQKMDFYFELLDSKGYQYAEMWFPHDAKAATFQTGRSTIEQFMSRGYPCKQTPKMAVQHGIDAARLIMPQCTFNLPLCYGGIEALKAYRRQFNEKTQQYANTPLHDWSSNGADAFRYFALVTQTSKPIAIPEPEIQTGYCLEDLWEADSDWKNDIIRI